jgi:hypothetical protein
MNRGRLSALLAHTGITEGAAGAFISNPAGIFVAGLVAFVLVVLFVGVGVLVAWALIVLLKLILPMLLIVGGIYIWIWLKKPREGVIIMIVGLVLFTLTESMVIR